MSVCCCWPTKTKCGFYLSSFFSLAFLLSKIKFHLDVEWTNMARKKNVLSSAALADVHKINILIIIAFINHSKKKPRQPSSGTANWIEFTWSIKCETWREKQENNSSKQKQQVNGDEDFLSVMETVNFWLNNSNSVSWTFQVSFGTKISQSAPVLFRFLKNGQKEIIIICHSVYIYIVSNVAPLSVGSCDSKWRLEMKLNTSTFPWQSWRLITIAQCRPTMMAFFHPFFQSELACTTNM